MNNARRPIPHTANAMTGVDQAGPSLSGLDRVGRTVPSGRRTFSNGSSERQGAAVGCASPRSMGRGAFYTAITEALGGIGLFLALAAVLTLAETLPDAIVGALATEEPKPECREQFTPDTRYVRHCNFHDGRGWIETKKDAK